MDVVAESNALADRKIANTAQVSIIRKQSDQLKAVVGTLIQSVAQTPVPSVEGKGAKLDVYA